MRHFMNPAVGRHLQGQQPEEPSAGFSGRLHITGPDGNEQIHHFTADDHDGLLGQIHEFLKSGSPHSSLTDADAMEAGGPQQSSGGVHAHGRDSGVIP